MKQVCLGVGKDVAKPVTKDSKQSAVSVVETDEQKFLRVNKHLGLFYTPLIDRHFTNLNAEVLEKLDQEEAAVSFEIYS
jgi:hypothetical protein